MNAAEYIIGYAAIAKATSAALGRSVQERTAKSWAHPDPEKRPTGLRARLPVYKYPDGRVYLSRRDLDVWAQAWLATTIRGATLPCAPPPHRNTKAHHA